VTTLDGKSAVDVACGYGQTLFVLEDAQGLPQVDSEEVAKEVSKRSK
jgi:hypothetical protein